MHFLKMIWSQTYTKIMCTALGCLFVVWVIGTFISDEINENVTEQNAAEEDMITEEEFNIKVKNFVPVVIAVSPAHEGLRSMTVRYADWEVECIQFYPNTTHQSVSCDWTHKKAWDKTGTPKG